MYKEINPTVFAIVTFPFLFGVMFGDIGHGGLLLITGSLMCIFDKQIKSIPSIAGLAAMRYLLLMMGIFSFYNGWIYNEFFAIPFEVFGSCYEEEPMVLSNTPNATNTKTMFDPADYGYKRVSDDCVYTLGLDPRWLQSSSVLTFTNSFKMKLAVIFAILQMCLGILMKGLNSLYFKSLLDFFTEFIPQMVLMLALFGWMDTLIVAKWLYPKNVEEFYVEKTSDYNAVFKAPSIISTMIDIFLNFADSKDKYYYLFEGQAYLSLMCLALALISVPVMLVIKPLVIRHRMLISHGSTYVEEHKSSIAYESNVEVKPFGKNEVFEKISQALAEEGSAGHESHAFGDIFIHQLIETIEFTLGTVSNTASYLRLWALSLAHSQLAAVAMEQLEKRAFGSDNTIMTAIMVNIYY